MPSYSHIIGQPPACKGVVVQGPSVQLVLKITTPRKSLVGTNRASPSLKIYENIEEGDDYHSEEDIYSGNSQPNSPSVSSIDLQEASNPGNMSRKRSASDCGEDGAFTGVKRVRASLMASEAMLKSSIYLALPGVLWAEIFSLLHPADLGRQRRTCKLFKKYLDDGSIWQRSRKRYLPDYPKPVFGLTEWEMLSVMWGSGCMLCEKVTTKGKGSNKPTATAVAYWPFRLRCCKGCLEENTTKEFALPSTLFPAALLPALPFGIVDLRNNWISNPTHYQPNIGLTRIFWNADIRDILGRYREAICTGVQEEWLKNLEGEGVTHRLDIMRIERFEMLKTSRNSAQRTWADGARATRPQSRQKQYDLLQQEQRSSIGEQSSAQELRQHRGGLGMHQDTSASATNNVTAGYKTMGSEARSVLQPHGFQGSNRSMDYLAQQLDSSPDSSSTRVQYTPQEAVKVKTKHRSDIEARCLQMIPYLKPGLLAHMPAFQAAIKIAIPPNEHAWENLKALLLKQIPDTENQERCKQADPQKAQRHEEYNSLEQRQKEIKEANDGGWNESQIPVRTKLGAYADEIIMSWVGGITKHTASKFAVDVLSYCRYRFYEDNPYSADDPHHINPLNTTTWVGREALEAPTSQRLTLENMKFVFDNKIRPYTDQFGRELFICNGCEYNPRFYAFEGVIQHYAAKHTSQLSVGPIVVHWRTDWPAKPPFSSDPLAVGISPYQTTATFYPPIINTNSQGQPYLSSQELMAHQLPGFYAQTSANSYPSRTTYSFANYSSYNCPPHHQQIHHTIAQPEPANKAHPVYLEQMAKDAREAWFQLSGIKDLPSSVRVRYVISKTIPSFQAKFSFEPSLAVFIQTLKEYASLKPVKNANGLLCLECHQNPPPPASDGTSRVGRLFTFSALLQHFEVVHIVRNRAVTKPDWKTGMIKLPETRIIGMIRQAQGIDKEKYKLLKNVFPLAFSLPLPGKNFSGTINHVTRGLKLEDRIHGSNPSGSITTEAQKGTPFSNVDKEKKCPPKVAVGEHIQQDSHTPTDYQYPTRQTPVSSTVSPRYDSHKPRDGSTKATDSVVPRSHDINHRCRSPLKSSGPGPQADLHQCDNKPTMTAAELFLESFLRDTEVVMSLKKEKDVQLLQSSPPAPEQAYGASPLQSLSPWYHDHKAEYSTSFGIHSHDRPQVIPDRLSTYNNEIEPLPLDADQQSGDAYCQNASRRRETAPSNNLHSSYPSIASRHTGKRARSPDQNLVDEQYSRQSSTYSKGKYVRPLYARENRLYFNTKYPPSLPNDYHHSKCYKGDHQDIRISQLVYPVPPLPLTFPAPGCYATKYGLNYRGRARSRDSLLSPQPPSAQYPCYLPPRSPVTEVIYRCRSRSPTMVIRRSSENVAISYASEPVPLPRDYGNLMHDQPRTREASGDKDNYRLHNIQPQQRQSPSGPLAKAGPHQTKRLAGRGGFYGQGRGKGSRGIGGGGTGLGNARGGSEGIKTGKGRY